MIDDMITCELFNRSEAIAKHQEPIRFLSYFKIPFIVTTLSLASIDLMFAIIDSLYLTDMVSDGMSCCSGLDMSIM